MTALRLDGAIRTSKRKREARSPQQQRDMIAACAERNGYDVVAIHDSGRDESGQTMDRASLNAVIERVGRGETDGLIVALADRLGRAPIEEAMGYVRRLTGVGKLVLADMGGVPIDLNDPAGESNLVFQLQMARQYWLASQQRALRTREEAVRAGKFVGPTPLGYRRENGRLYPGEQWPIVERAYELAGQRGIHAAVDHLKAAVPGREWNTDHVRRLLASRVYLGESRSGEFVNPEAHDGVDFDTWTAAQSEPQDRRANGDYPLSNLVFCGRCDWGLVGALQSVNGKRYRRMRCSNPDCRGGSSISAEKLETGVRDFLGENLGHWRISSGADGVEAARGALRRAETERTRYAEDTEFRTIVGDQAWRAGARKRVAEVQRLGREYRELAHAAARSRDVPGPDQLSDPVKLTAALSWANDVAGLRVSVTPGRGARRVVFDVLDDSTRELAA